MVSPLQQPGPQDSLSQPCSSTRAIVAIQSRLPRAPSHNRRHEAESITKLALQTPLTSRKWD